MNGKIYIVIKRNGNENGLIYDRRLYNKRCDAQKDFLKNDTLLICDEKTVFYADNFNGWTCEKPLKIINK